MARGPERPSVALETIGPAILPSRRQPGVAPQLARCVGADADRSDGVTDVSSNNHTYLVEAYDATKS
jgi:hypothetical protein